MPRSRFKRKIIERIRNKYEKIMQKEINKVEELFYTVNNISDWLRNDRTRYIITRNEYITNERHISNTVLILEPSYAEDLRRMISEVIHHAVDNPKYRIPYINIILKAAFETAKTARSRIITDKYHHTDDYNWVVDKYREISEIPPHHVPIIKYYYHKVYYSWTIKEYEGEEYYIPSVESSYKYDPYSEEIQKIKNEIMKIIPIESIATRIAEMKMDGYEIEYENRNEIELKACDTSTATHSCHSDVEKIYGEVEIERELECSSGPYHHACGGNYKVKVHSRPAAIAYHYNSDCCGNNNKIIIFP